jgi:Secretion system C-terminal sorting domain
VSTQGNYIVTAINANGCEASSLPVTVTASGCVPPAVPVINLSGSNIIPPGGMVILSTPVASGYLWSTGETTRSILVSDSGSYTVTVFNGPACSSTSLPVDIIIQQISTGIFDFNGVQTDYALFPNPFSSSFSILFTMNEPDNTFFQLTDIIGREVYSQTIKAVSGLNNYQIDASGLTRGVYFAWLTTNGNRRSIKVFAE